jgi:hypothetical protein
MARDDDERKPHPSGRPIHRRKFGVTSIPRVPYSEPLTPGLCSRPLAQAIGFHRFQVIDDRDE